MKKTPLYRINLNHQFDGNPRKILRFSNQSVRKLEEKIAQINLDSDTPKWALELLKHSEHSYSIMLLTDELAAEKVMQQYLKQDSTSKSVNYTDAVSGKQYVFYSWALGEKIKRDTVSVADIDNHMNKRLGKMKTAIRKLAKHYEFEELEVFENLHSSFSLA